jgi:hypothetical protein
VDPRDVVHTGRSSLHFDAVRASQGRLPKLQFSVFNGDDPQLWRSRCENYFEMYGVVFSVDQGSLHAL